MKNEAINELYNYWLIPEGRVSRVVSREVEKMEQHIADLEAQLSKARRKIYLFRGFVDAWTWSDTPLSDIDYQRLADAYAEIIDGGALEDK